jgi:hypothetical protein
MAVAERSRARGSPELGIVARNGRCAARSLRAACVPPSLRPCLVAAASRGRDERAEAAHSLEIAARVRSVRLAASNRGIRSARLAHARSMHLIGASAFTCTI